MARSSQPPPQSPGFFTAAGVPAWLAGHEIIRNEKGNPKACLFNAILALSQDPIFTTQNAIRYDAFRTQTMLCAPVPWDPNVTAPRPWTDQDDREVTAWLQNNQVVVGESTAASAVQAVAGRNKYHPVMDYLNSLSWDGVPRLDKWLVTYVGAEDTEYTSGVGPRWMISGVARVFDPGCKADCVLILEGPQGILKSTTFDVLGGPFYGNDVAAIGTKDAQEQILGVWIVELDELEAVTRAVDLAHVKAFLSRRRDKFRLPYAHRSQPHPRQCIFGATTNRDTWQRDETGARRWWPVKCGTIDIDALRTDRDQLWAEARDRYLANEPWWLDDSSLVEAQGIEAGGRYEPDPWEEEIIEKTSLKDETTTSEVLCLLGLPLERRGRSEQMRVASVLRHLGWTREREKNTVKSTRGWIYRKPMPKP